MPITSSSSTTTSTTGTATAAAGTSSTTNTEGLKRVVGVAAIHTKTNRQVYIFTAKKSNNYIPGLAVWIAAVESVLETCITGRKVKKHQIHACAVHTNICYTYKQTNKCITAKKAIIIYLDWQFG